MPNGSFGSGIPAPELKPNSQPLKFSFKHLDTDSQKFPLERCTPAFMEQFVKRMKELSGWSIDQFIDQNNHEHRHIINFPETTEPDGFNTVDLEQFAYHEAWQFQLCQDQHWRVHGVLIEDIFYIVWLDPDHQLYP